LRKSRPRILDVIISEGRVKYKAVDGTRPENIAKLI